MKKILFTFLVFILEIWSVIASWPPVVCTGLPGCSSGVTGKSFFSFLWKLIASGIKYVAVFAVIALVIAGMMYLTSWWEEEQVKKAKKWITWALVGVFLSTSAWAIINLVNSFRIN